LRICDGFEIYYPRYIAPEKDRCGKSAVSQTLKVSASHWSESWVQVADRP
jgi:hypothetical protein